MKKIFSLAAAVLAALTMSAEITNYTCAEAVQNLPASGTGTDSVAVTGYVTKLSGGVSSNQQRFYINDGLTYDAATSVQSYWCNLPEEYTETGLVIGDKVMLKGFLTNYNQTAEIMRGEIVVLEKVVVEYDTTTVSVCDAIEEGLSLNQGANSGTDIFRVEGRVATVPEVNNYGGRTFFMNCEIVQFQAYACSGDSVVLGDSVVVVGPLTNYNGIVEIANGKVFLVERGVATIDTITATVAEAVAAGMLLAQNGTSTEMYEITGYIDSIASPYSSSYKNASFYITDDMANPTYDLEVYRGAVDDADSTSIVVGAQIKIVSPLKRYYKAANEETGAEEIDLIETVAGKQVIILSLPQGDGVEDIKTNAVATKQIINGQLIIRKGEKTYNAQGVEL